MTDQPGYGHFNDAEAYDAALAPVAATRAQYRWLSWPIIILGMVIPFAIFLRVERQFLAGSLLAYVNCVIIVWTILHVIRTNPLLGILPATAFPFLLMAWPASSLYYAISGTVGYYTTLQSMFAQLDGMVRVQLAVLLFLMTYIPVLLLFHRRQGHEPGPPLQVAGRLTVFLTVLCMAIVALYDLQRVMGENVARTAIVWWTWGLFNYLVGLFLIVGALSPYASRTLKIILFFFFGVHLFVFAVGNARLPGLMPVLFYFAGYLLLSHTTQKRKILACVLLLTALPLYVLIGNTTRAVLGSAGFKDFTYRMEVLFRGAGHLAEGRRGSFRATMDRLFMTGGHNIIVRTPEQVPYYPFEPGEYAIEMAQSLIPGILHFEPRYRTNWHLRRYGFNIGPTSVEISLLGHFWMLGGWLAVLLGGVATGLVHGGALLLVRRAAAVSWTKGGIYSAAIAIAMFDTFGNDFLGLFRSLIWHAMMGFCVYVVVRVLLPLVDEPPSDEGYLGDSALSYGYAPSYR